MKHKICRYCGSKTKIRNGGGYLVCGCGYSLKEHNLEMDKQYLKSRLVDVSKEIYKIKEKHSQNVQAAS